MWFEFVPVHAYGISRSRPKLRLHYIHPSLLVQHALRRSDRQVRYLYRVADPSAGVGLSCFLCLLSTPNGLGYATV